MLALPFRRLFRPNPVKPDLLNEVTLITCHIDSPAQPATLTRLELDLRGWLSFDRQFDVSELNISAIIDNETHPVNLSQRPDVAGAYPDLFTTGFEQLIDLSRFADTGRFDAGVKIDLLVHYCDQHFRQTLDLHLDANASKRSSYFRSNPNEHDPELDYDSLTTGQRQSWQEHGFIVVESFYSPEQVDEINAYMDQLWATRRELDWPVTVDQHIGTAQERRILFAASETEIRDHSYKLNDLYLASERIRHAVLDERLNKILSALMYAGTPMICSSLYFEKGSQQRKHFDTFFMPPLIKNRMLATWIALEDVTESSGPLGYYPASHKIEPYVFRNGRYNLVASERDDCYRYIDTQLQQREIAVEYFMAKKGDLFIWHPQLLHGGNAIKDAQSTRRSLVTHYFCKEDHPVKDATEFAPNRYFLNRDYLQPHSSN